MSESARTRRVIALAAAYVVALQALLLPLSAAVGGPFESSLCAAAAPVDHASSPAGHDSGCPCAPGCRTPFATASSIRRPRLIQALARHVRSKTTMNRTALIIAALSAALATSPALAHDYTVGSLKIDHPWARATPKGASVGGGYMKITNSGT